MEDLDWLQLASARGVNAEGIARRQRFPVADVKFKVVFHQPQDGSVFVAYDDIDLNEARAGAKDGRVLRTSHCAQGEHCERGARNGLNLHERTGIIGILSCARYARNSPPHAG